MSSRLSLSNVRLNKVGLACVTLLLLLLIGVSSFTTVNGNEFDDSESHSGRSRLHHSRPSSASSAILDAHQEVVPISLVESLAEESHAVEVDVGYGVITVYNDEEDPDLLSAVNEENLAMTAVAAKYRQLRLNGAVSRLSKAAMAERQRKMVSNKRIAKKSTPGAGKGVAFRKVVEANQMTNRRNGISKVRTITKGPTRTAGKKLGVFLELETELESELESKSMVAVGAYPLFGLFGSNVGNLRNAIQADPVPLVLNGFTYVLDGAAAGVQLNRIQRAYGPVNVPFTTRPVKQLPVEWCDVQYNPVVPFVGPAVPASRTNVAGGGRRIQQSGHIIGYAIGGSSDHAINFYPQHRSSNNQGGRWGKTEAIALHVAAVGGCPAGSVSVDIVFNTWSVNGYPTAGTYDIEANAVCVAALNAAGGGAGCPGGGVAANAGVGNAYVQTFCRWAAAPGGGVLRYSSPFSNDINDVINTLGLPAAARYFP